MFILCCSIAFNLQKFGKRRQNYTYFHKPPNFFVSFLHFQSILPKKELDISHNLSIRFQSSGRQYWLVQYASLSRSGTHWRVQTSRYWCLSRLRWQGHLFHPSCQIWITRQQVNCYRVTLYNILNFCRLLLAGVECVQSACTLLQYSLNVLADIAVPLAAFLSMP